MSERDRSCLGIHDGSRVSQRLPGRFKRISPGKLANLVVLDGDIFSIDPMEITEAQVSMTMLGGRMVYQK